MKKINGENNSHKYGVQQILNRCKINTSIHQRLSEAQICNSKNKVTSTNYINDAKMQEKSNNIYLQGIKRHICQTKEIMRASHDNQSKHKIKFHDLKIPIAKIKDKKNNKDLYLKEDKFSTRRKQKQQNFTQITDLLMNNKINNMKLGYQRKKSKISHSLMKNHMKVSIRQNLKKMDEQKKLQYNRKENYLNTQFNRRKAKLKQITQQNKKIYKRINSQKSLYSNQELHKSIDSSCSVSRGGSRCKILPESRRKSVNSERLNRISRKNHEKQSILTIQSQNINKIRQEQASKFAAIFINHPNFKQNNKNISKIEKNRNYSVYGSKTTNSNDYNRDQKKQQIPKSDSFLHQIVEEMYEDYYFDLTIYDNNLQKITNILVKNNLNFRSNVVKQIAVVDQQLIYQFKLDVQDINIIDFQSNFTGSENITLKGMSSHQRIIFLTVQPRNQSIVAQVQLHEGWKLVTKFRFKKRPISKQKQLYYILPEVTSMKNDTKIIQTIFDSYDIVNTSMDVINKLLEESRINFIDTDFPFNDTSIVAPGDKNLIDDMITHWRRPREFLEVENYLLIDRINHHHLIKGKLGDNAFYSIIVTLSLKHQALIERLFFNQKQVNFNGIYRLKFCKNGEWQTVKIDDVMPCDPLGKPKFASSTLKDIWFSLVQKAYAKIHRCYMKLHDLDVSNVLMDLTGCPTYVEKTSHPNFKAIIHNNLTKKNIVVLYDTEQKQFDQEEFTTLKNYAYPIIDQIEDEGKIYYKILSHTHQYEEVVENDISNKFQFICICYIHNWEQVRVKGKFVTVEAGTEDNQLPLSMSKWYYTLELAQKSSIHVCLHQQDSLIGNNQYFKNYVYCSLMLLPKTIKSVLKPRVLKRYSHNREISFQIELQAGTYLIVPFINSQSQILVPENENDRIIDVFQKLDLLMRRQLKYPELAIFYKVVGQVFDQEEFNQMLKKYTQKSKGIGLHAFKKIWATNKLYWKDNINFYDKERLWTISVHSKEPISLLIKNNVGTELNNRAHCELIAQTGEQLHLPLKSQQKYIRVKYLKTKCQIVQYMVQNKHDTKIEVQLDCSTSKGYKFIPKKGKNLFNLDSGQREFVMKIIPLESMPHHQLVRNQNLKIRTFD